MRIIVSGNQRIAAIIKKKKSFDKNYRLSSYSFPFSEGRVYILLNTLTGMTIEMSDMEWTLLQRIRDHSIRGEQLSGTFEELVQYGFLVEENSNDYDLYKLVISILRLMSHEEKGTKTYTILPTTGCNARCIYCYEEGMPVYSMNEETADRVAEFIDETRWQEAVKLIWFGGEPLVGSQIISRICSRLKEKNIPYRSQIITNATMLTPALLKEAVDLWHLESAQVSVDGKREDYEARKQYVNPAYNYNAMMDAVGNMLNKGIKVTLRCNCDENNQVGLKTFFDDVNARFGNPDNLFVYPAMLFQAQADEDGVELYRKIQGMNIYLQELGLQKKETDKKAYKLKLNRCGADSGDKSVVIAPDGKLYHCEHLPGNKAFGSVFDSHTHIDSDERANLPANEQCRTCCFLPECTPFFKNGCPDFFEYCYAFKQIETEEMLRRLITKNNISGHD